jgi:predicted acetyltransferase
MAVEPRDVTLEPASAADGELLSNLLELYIHDLSAAFPNIELGANGRFGYPKLSLYFTEPERRFAFLVHAQGKVAGFALVTRGSPASDDPDVWDIAEFFVLRRYRRAGVGRRAASELWKRMRGMWIVRVSEGNLGALPFWSEVIRDFTRGAVSESRRAGTPHAWRVFEFSNHASELETDAE